MLRDRRTGGALRRHEEKDGPASPYHNRPAGPGAEPASGEGGPGPEPGDTGGGTNRGRGRLPVEEEPAQSNHSSGQTGQDG